jgi:hypothetical protein
MSKARIVMEIVTLLQGMPVDEFARQNLFAEGNKVIVKCALNATVASAAGELCKRSIATALRRYSYRFMSVQMTVLADLYATALEQLEPEADRPCESTCATLRRRRLGGMPWRRRQCASGSPPIRERPAPTSACLIAVGRG